MHSIDKTANRSPGKGDRSRWSHLIPVVFITFSLAYLDRANFGFGAAGGMAVDLHISASASSLLGSLFFLGYFFFQVPAVHWAARRNLTRIIFYSLIGWGLLAAATGLVRDIRLLMGIRFLLGVVESLVFPSLVLLLSRWFTSRERSRANTLLIFGNPVTIVWMSVLSGYLVHALGWRWMFVLEGIPAIVWAFFWRNLVPAGPREAPWMDPVQAEELLRELEREQQQIPAVRNYISVFRSRKIVLLCLVYGLWSLGVYGFVIWLPTILSESNKNMVRTGWLAAVPYLLVIPVMFALSHFSDRSQKRKPFIWVPLGIAGLCFYGSYLSGAENFGLSFFFLCLAGISMYAPYGPFFSMITETLPSNVSGVSIALINSFGALGSFAGTYLVGYLNSVTHRFSASYLLMAAALFLSALLVLAALADPAEK
jgi:sugar phosphate permease